MIYLVTGTPGAGKSFYALRKIAEALERGKPVATNVQLEPDFAQRIGRHHVGRWLIPGRKRSVERRADAGVLITSDLRELMRVRVAGRKEGRWVAVIDEGAGYLNSRHWSQQDRADVIAWFMQHRKLGADVYLIVQDESMIDKQVRTLAEVEIRLRNLKRARVWGVPLSPFNLFLAIWTWAGANGIVMRRELYRLDWRRKLYDTTQIVHDDHEDAEAEAIVLPRPQGVTQPSVLPLTSAEGAPPSETHVAAEQGKAATDAA